MAESNSPIIIYSGGIPIAPADLDFGGSVTKAQINALSSFSQMVNAIPAEGNTWVPTGSETWDIYQLVLTMAQFAETAQGVVPSAASFATRQVAVAESNAKINVVEPIPQATVDTPSSLAALNESISPLLEQAGFQFNRSPLLEQAGFQVNSSRLAPIPFDGTTSPAVSPTLSGTQPTGLAAMFLKLQAHLVTATRPTRSVTLSIPRRSTLRTFTNRSMTAAGNRLPSLPAKVIHGCPSATEAQSPAR